MSNEMSTFDRMVSGISDDERKEILSKVKKSDTTQSISNSVNEVRDENIKVALYTRFQQEGFFLRLWLKIKSAIFSIPVENLYNTSMVARIAHEVEHNFPGIIDHRHSILTSSFYEKVLQLRGVQRFFQPFFSFYAENTGRFYHYLGTVLMPDVSERAEKETDPYQYPFTKNLSKETRLSLLQKLDNIMDTLPELQRAYMYSSIKSLEWLFAFCRMDLESLLSAFSNNRDCNYAIARSAFSTFSKIMNICNIPASDSLNALFKFYLKEGPVNSDTDFNEEKFSASAENETNLLEVFSQTVPVKDVARVVFDNALYEPGIYSGGEEWFLKFKSQWRMNFDVRWNSWMTDYKKFRLSIRIKNYFEHPELPLFPQRPWTKLWTGVTFKYELALGFMNYFFNDVLKSYDETLKILMLEGDFLIKDNAIEYTDDMNLIHKVRSSLTYLETQLMPTGEFGAEFEKLRENTEGWKSSREKSEVLMEDIEKYVLRDIDDFGKICRSLKNIFDAVVNGIESESYGALSNFMKIQGKNNKRFRENVSMAAAAFEHGYELLTEAEAIDTPTE